NGSSTNAAALFSVSGAQASTYTFQLFLREAAPFIHQPALQPILQVYSVTGEPTPGGTGSVAPDLVTLVHTSDFLLNGGSNDAGDLVEVALQSAPVTSSVTMGPSLTTPALIAIGMDVPVSSTGTPGNVTSVLSANLSTLYVYGTDYTIVAYGPYHQYALLPLTSSVAITQLQITGNVLTVTAANEFTVPVTPLVLSGITDPTFGPILNGQTVALGTSSPTQFTANFTNPNLGPTATSGLATGSAIQPNQTVSVTYNQFFLYERLTFVPNEQQVLSGTLPTILNNDGFIRNTWLPESYTTGIPALPVQYGDSLTLDGWDGLYGVDGGLDIPGSLALNPSGLVGNSVPH